MTLHPSVFAEWSALTACRQTVSTAVLPREASKIGWYLRSNGGVIVNCISHGALNHSFCGLFQELSLAVL